MSTVVKYKLLKVQKIYLFSAGEDCFELLDISVIAPFESIVSMNLKSLFFPLTHFDLRNPSGYYRGWFFGDIHLDENGNPIRQSSEKSFAGKDDLKSSEDGACV